MAHLNNSFFPIALQRESLPSDVEFGHQVLQRVLLHSEVFPSARFPSTTCASAPVCAAPKFEARVIWGQPFGTAAENTLFELPLALRRGERDQHAR